MLSSIEKGLVHLIKKAICRKNVLPCYCHMPLQQTYLILGNQKNQIDSNMQMHLKSCGEDAPALQFVNTKKFSHVEGPMAKDI